MTLKEVEPVEPDHASEADTAGSGRDYGNVSPIARLALPIVLLAVVVMFSALRPETYFTVSNLRAVALTQAVLVIVALAALFPMVTGAFDVSVGANLSVGSILAAGLAAKQGWPDIAAIFAALVVCTLIGLLNGVIVVYVGINPFIATLGMSTVLSGAVLWYSQGTVIFQGVPKALVSIGRDDVLGIPLPVLLMAAIVLVAWYVTEQTPIGRYLYALGGSYEAARLSGLNVGRLTLLTFVISGGLCGIAGIIQAGILGAGNPTVGPQFLLPAFAAVFLGATAIKIGSFNVLGTVVAVFLLAAGVTGLEQVGVAVYVEPIFNGLALILGVGLVKMLHRDLGSR